MDPIILTPIGVIRSPFTRAEGMPMQAVSAEGVRGSVELDPAYAEGLCDLEGFSHIILIYRLHLVRAPALTVLPFLDDTPRGVFATRAPKRPNALGLSTVRLLSVEGTTLYIEEVDVVDGTPLLDIKPYVPQVDDRAGARIGWYEGRIAGVTQARADGRFVDE